MEVSVVSIVRALLLTLPVSLFLYRRYKRRAPFEAAVDKIPGPPKLPVLGNALDLAKSPAELFTLAVTELSKLGPVVRIWVLSEPFIILSRARDVERILQGMVHHVKGNTYHLLHCWLGQGLLTSHGEKWRVHRKVLTPAFHFNILHEFLPIFNKHALQMTQCLDVEADTDTEFNIFKYSSPCALDIICESSMGIEIDAQNDRNLAYVKSVVRVGEIMVKRHFSAWLRPDWLFKLSFTKRELDRHLKVVNDFTDKVISNRRQQLKQDQKNAQVVDNDVGGRRCLAFLDLLLAAEEEESEHMTQKDIRDQVSTFMFEGHDTVSTATSWVLFMLGTYPEHQARVVEELISVFGDSGRDPDMADLANLKYLERCIKETLRLYPSVAFIERGITQDAIIDDFTLPAGATVSTNIFLLHRDPDIFPDPEKFDPDRFLPENTNKRHPFAYIPFSAGPRNCIGQKFALMEEKVVVSTVLRKFRVEAAHAREEAVLQIGVVLRPANGLHVRLYDRQDHPRLRIARHLETAA